MVQLSCLLFWYQLLALIGLVCGNRMFCCVLRCLVDYLCVVLAWFSVYVLLYVL